MANKKIWIFHPYATSPNMSGLTRPYEFAKKIIKIGYEVEIFTSSYLHYTSKNLIKGNELFIEEEVDGIKFNFIKTCSYEGNGLSRIKNFVDYYINLKKYIKNQKIEKDDIADIIYASSPHPLSLLAGIKIAKKLNKPCISEIRDFWPEVFFLGGKLKEKSILGRLLLLGENYLYKKSNALIFLKEGDFNYILERKWDLDQGGNIDLTKIHYINNGVDNEEFTSNIKKYNFFDKDLESNKFKIIYTGAIRKVNNVGKILDVAKLFLNDKEIMFIIYGDGNEKESLEKRVKEENISNVIFKGYIEKKYIPFILSKSSLNILNYSDTEYNWSRGNSSNKLFEYMASGKPIISTVKMGYSIINKYNCGIELEESNIENFYTAIQSIKSLNKNEYDKLCKNAKQGARDFDFKSLSKKIINVIESVTLK